jgi:hypothetical protein
MAGDIELVIEMNLFRSKRNGLVLNLPALYRASETHSFPASYLVTGNYSFQWQV